MSGKRPLLAHKQSECIGCAFCVEIAPDAFAMNEDGLAYLLNPIGKSGPLTLSKILPEEVPSLQEAARGCPVNIISIR